MAIDFPNSPTLNQTYASGGKTWRWDGSSWGLIMTEMAVDTNYQPSLTNYDGGAPETILFHEIDPIDSGEYQWSTTTTRTNLLPDPNCENASIATYWQAISITESRSSDYVYSGTYSLKGVIDNAAASQYFQVLQTAGAMIDVTAGQTYTFSTHIYLPSTNTADSTWRAQLYFWNGTGYTSPFSGTTTTITRGNWTRLSVSATVPSGYYKALPRILSTTFLAVGQIAYVDAWLLETGSTLLPYFDGTYADAYTGHTLFSKEWNGTTNASTSTATWGIDSTLEVV